MENQWSLKLLNVLQVHKYVKIKHPDMNSEEIDRLISLVAYVVEMMCRRPDFIRHILSYKVTPMGRKE